ncbi:hypothetical protein AURDEDRAFT_168926 [Auricularia subglabra TFB-10046 SS5]|nr:hypothetical protein AURDEDRAFT_168926 [Auricularia subglabra TFB-10046 SS5]
MTVPAGAGTVTLRARTTPDLCRFPLPYFADTVQILLHFKDMVYDKEIKNAKEAFHTLFRAVPSAADLVSLDLCLRDFVTEVAVVTRCGIVRLEDQPNSVRDILHLDEVRLGSLEFEVRKAIWMRADALLPVRDGAIRLRAHSVPRISPFPRPGFNDTCEKLAQFTGLIARNAYPEVEAFKDVFGVSSIPTDFESLELCARLLRDSPPTLRKQFREASISQATWSRFVHCCRIALDGAASLHARGGSNYRNSPLLHPARRSAMRHADEEAREVEAE